MLSPRMNEINHRGTRLERRDLREHVVDARRLRAIVARGVVLRLADLDVFHDAVDDVRGEALAARVPELGHRPRVIKLEPERFRELEARIAQEREVASRDLHVIRPRGHHRRVVDAVHQNFVDPGRLERVLPREVARDLARGSGGSERAGEADDDRLLSRQARRHVDLEVGGEVLVQLDRGEGVAHLDHHLARVRRRRRSGKNECVIDSTIRGIKIKISHLAARQPRSEAWARSSPTFDRFTFQLTDELFL